MADPLSFRSTPTFRELNGRFARAGTELFESRRDLMRDLGRRFAELSRTEAPARTWSFRESIGFRTFAEGSAFGFRIHMAQPLGTFILEGTEAHVISARDAAALYFYWPKIGMDVVVPKGGGFPTHVSGGKLWVGKGFVDHPGTKPNPFTSRAYRQWL